MDNDLYREEILEHYRHPQNFGTLKKPTHTAVAFNPICGDRLSLELAVDRKGTVTGVAFSGSGCALSVASASLFTEWLKGKQLSTLKKSKDDQVVALLHAPIAPVRLQCVLLVKTALNRAV